MDATINTVNITGAALLTQFLLTIIMFVAAALVRQGEGYISHNSPSVHQAVHRLPWIILGSALITVGCLVFSDEFTTVWKPLFGGNASSPTIRSSNATLIMFVIDIACVAYLVRYTGGSRVSPFSPIYFILPGLAIFLREPYSRIVFYIVAVAVVFVLSLINSLIKYGEDFYPGSYQQTEAISYAYSFVSIACLVLTTIIAYVTRPI